MYQYTYRILPDIHLLGSACSTIANRKCRLYSVLFYNNYVKAVRSNRCKINRYERGEIGFRHVTTSTNDASSASTPSSANEGRHFVLSQGNGPESLDFNQERGNRYLDDVDRMLELVRGNGQREIDEFVFECIDRCILQNLDRFTIIDVSTLLQLTVKNYYSQNLIEALVLKLRSTDPSEFQVSTLALILQNLGRILPSDFKIERLDKFLGNFCEYLVGLENISESHFSSIVYGFQRLHYQNDWFLERVTRRYKKNLNNVNVNSLIISLSSLVKLDFFDPEIILNIYRQISKSVTHMTLQTTVQLATTIAKIHEHYHGNNYCVEDRVDRAVSQGEAAGSEGSERVDELQAKDHTTEIEPDLLGEPAVSDSLKLYRQNYKLMNTILKTVCTNYIDQLNVLQISLLLNSMNKLNHRKVLYLSKLIQAIPSNYYNLSLLEPASKSASENDINNMNNRDLVDLYINDHGSLDGGRLDAMEADFLISGDNRAVAKYEAELRERRNARRNKERNVYTFFDLPECPFNYEATLKKLQAVEINNLILISDAVFGLEYYTEYSLNLLFVIREIISPILHEIKANHIAFYMLSFTNIHQTTHQLNRVKIGPRKKRVDFNELRSMLRSLDHASNPNWFEEAHLIGGYANGVEGVSEERARRDQIASWLARSHWKEDLALSCFENFLRHINFIKSSRVMLRKFKLLFLMLAHDVYLPVYPRYFDLTYLVAVGPSNSESSENLDPTEERVGLSDHGSVESGDGVNCVSPEGTLTRVPAIMPQNIIETLYRLYNSKASMNDGLECADKEEKDEEQPLESQLLPDNVSVEEASAEFIRLGGRRIYIDKEVGPFNVDVVMTFDSG